MYVCMYVCEYKLFLHHKNNASILVAAILGAAKRDQIETRQFSWTETGKAWQEQVILYTIWIFFWGGKNCFISLQIMRQVQKMYLRCSASLNQASRQWMFKNGQNGSHLILIELLVITVMLVSHSSVSPRRSMFWTYAGSLWWTISSPSLWSRFSVCRANSWMR